MRENHGCLEHHEAYPQQKGPKGIWRHIHQNLRDLRRDWLKMTVYYWLDEDGKKPEYPIFKTEAEAKTSMGAMGEHDCCKPGEHSWERSYTAWEDLASYCYKCGLVRDNQ